MKNKVLSFVRWDTYHVWYEYGFLSLLILLPLLLPGYILTLDMVFTPHIAWPTDSTSAYPLQLLLWVLHYLLPVDVIEKIIMVVILICSGVGMYYLFESFLTKADLKNNTVICGAYFAGLFYMINPFVYSRFMAGQWMVLLGYALLPFFIRSLFSYMRTPTYSQAIRTGLWIFTLITVSLHQIGIIIIPLIAVIAMGWWRYNHQPQIIRYMWGFAIIVGVPIALSLFWLVPAVVGVGTISESVASFDANDFAAFSMIGGVGAVLRLQGFWVEARDLYVLPQSLVPLWGVWFLFIWALVLVGVKKYWKTYRPAVFLALFCIVVGVIASVSPIAEWASHYVPVIAGYREPHKFVMLIALGFSLAGGLGLAYVILYCQRRFGEMSTSIVKAVGLFLPIIITPVMLWGFSGQLAPKAYPAGWYEMNQTLKEQASHTKTLFLPWHQYANYSFSGRIIASPAEKFFEVPIVASDEPEFKDISPTTPNDTKRRVAVLVKSGHITSDRLRSMNIGYVLLAKEQDYEAYEYLNKDIGLQLIKDNEKLRLYKIREQ